MPLTQTQIDRVRPQKSLYRIPDGRGLSLEVRPTGSRCWRLRCRDAAGVQRTIAIGEYPEVGLEQARAVAATKRVDLTRSVLPKPTRRLAAFRPAPGPNDDILGPPPDEDDVVGVRAAPRPAVMVSALASGAPPTFGEVAAAWMEFRRRGDLAARTIRRDGSVLDRLTAHFRNDPVTDIAPERLLAACREAEAEGFGGQARKMRAMASTIFAFAIGEGVRGVRNVAEDIRGNVINARSGHMEAIVEPKAFGRLLHTLRNDRSLSPAHSLGLQLLSHVFTRPGELQNARWEEVDLDAALWTIPKARMNMRRDHLVPLTPQAIELLKRIRVLSDGADYVLPQERDRTKPMADNAFTSSLIRLGYGRNGAEPHVPHGFRSSASTLLREVGEFPDEHIEMQLAHVDRNKVRGAYNRALYLKPRTVMMRWWSDYIDRLAAGR